MINLVLNQVHNKCCISGRLLFHWGLTGFDLCPGGLSMVMAVLTSGHDGLATAALHQAKEIRNIWKSKSGKRDGVTLR